MTDEVHELLEAEISGELAKQIFELAFLAFPTSPKSVEDRIAEMLATAKSSPMQVHRSRRFLIFRDSQVVAHARTFVRNVNTDEGSLPVLALATVCSHPDLRGEGLGRKVTDHAFRQIGNPGWPDVSLFQTPVAPFYEKLGCRIVENQFVDRTCPEAPESSPWKAENQIMVYPGDCVWPTGTIDLNGRGY